jgi:hypothetical protein
MRLDFAGKVSVIAAVIFIVVGYTNTYDVTRGILGSVVGQSDGSYGNGNTFNNRGFILHAVVFGLLMYAALKYGMKV